MNMGSDEAPRDLLAHVLLPVATENDARNSARALAPYGPAQVTALHVVEKAAGAPDKTPVEQSKEIAERSFDAVRETFPDADDYVAYDHDIASAVFQVAADVDASAIAFRPRGGSRLVQLLAGDHALDLVTGNDRPVVALPDVEEEA